MEQIAIIKHTKNAQGGFDKREMNIDKSTWERIVKQKPSAGIKYELAPIKDKPVIELMKKEKEKEVVVETETELYGSSNKYDNYSDEELKDAAKNAEIKGYAVMKRSTLIKKLLAND